MAVRASEMRHDVARIKLVRLLGRLPIGPVVRELQEAAEGALLRLELLDLLDGVIGRADNDCAGRDQNIERVTGREIGKARGIDALKIVEPFVEAEGGVLARLLSR